MKRLSQLLGFLLLLVATLAACANSPSPSSEESRSLSLGYFPNITHAAGLVGIEEGIFSRHLAPEFRLEARAMNSGPTAVEALFSGSLDAVYIGPNPAINAHVRSTGEAIRIVSGATAGGSFLVVRPEINTSADLKGKKLASPQLGNTQDVALRSWLASQGFEAHSLAGGDVAVVPQENAQTLETFRNGTIDGAWVPEPWATSLIVDGGGKVLVDERDLWPGGKYVTAHLIVRTAFLRDHPDAVEALLRAHIEAGDFVNAHPDRAQRLVGEAIYDLTGSKLRKDVLAGAWGNLIFTNDPIASSLRISASRAVDLGFLPDAGLDRIYELSILNRLLAEMGRSPVSS